MRIFQRLLGSDAPVVNTGEQVLRGISAIASTLTESSDNLPSETPTFVEPCGRRQQMQALGRELGKDAEAIAVIRDKANPLGIQRGHPLYELSKGHAPERTFVGRARER